MRRRRLSLRSVALAGLALCACGAQPVPLSVQAGGSVALAVMGERIGDGTPGFGSGWLAASGRYDDQRGELVLSLRATGGGVEHPLVTQLVTRALPDPASDGGIANQGDTTGGLDVGVGQVLALVDVPAATPSGTYDVVVRQRRRVSATQWETLPGVGWSQRLSVLPAVVNGIAGQPTPPTAYVGPFAANVRQRVAALYPHPKVMIELADSPWPAAARIVVAYPTQKVQVLAVFEEQHFGRSSMVAFRDDPGAGQVTIDFVDPRTSVGALALVFELRAPFSAGRAAPSDFRVVSSTLYDSQGAVRSDTPGIGVIR
jgi:hypothetical protein